MRLPSLIVKSLSAIKANPQHIRIGEGISDLLIGHNNVANQLACDPNGSDVVPSNVAMVAAQHLGNGLVDVAITDGSAVPRAIDYHVEYDTNPNFTTNPRGHTLGPWRNSQFVLPNGTWYVRAYSQLRYGGPPSVPVMFPTPIVITGSAAQPLLPSHGSGTGPSGQGGFGAGKTISR